MSSTLKTVKLFNILSIIFVYTSLVSSCPPNEIYSKCGNNICQDTCENPNLSKVCRSICKPGCVCIEGYVRNKEGKCIQLNKCPKKCGLNEFFACGSACDTTCATLGETCPIVNINCNEMCYCINGYARNSEGICVPVDECPPKQCKTDENAIIAPCGDPNPTTCENMDNPTPSIFLKICYINGCKCKEGFVLGPQGKCIPPSECPKIVVDPLFCDVSNNEEPKCALPCPPELTCGNYIDNIYPMCESIPNQSCEYTCRCKPGFLRNRIGLCIPMSQCCDDPNAELVECPNRCPGGTCGQIAFEPCNNQCFYGCQCKEGCVKSSINNQTCIPIASCETQIQES